MRIESVTNTSDGLEIIWADEAEIDYNAGVIRAYIDRISHDAIPDDLLEQLVDAVVQIIDAGRVRRNQVADKFSAPR